MIARFGTSIKTLWRCLVDEKQGKMQGYVILLVFFSLLMVQSNPVEKRGGLHGNGCRLRKIFHAVKIQCKRILAVSDVHKYFSEFITLYSARFQ